MATNYLDLKIDGNSVTDVIPGHVSVNQELNRHWWCNIHCRHLEDQRAGAGQQTVMALPFGNAIARREDSSGYGFVSASLTLALPLPLHPQPCPQDDLLFP